MNLNSYNLVYQVKINQIGNDPQASCSCRISVLFVWKTEGVPPRRQTSGSHDLPGLFNSDILFFDEFFWFSSLSVTVSEKLLENKSQ